VRIIDATEFTKSILLRGLSVVQNINGSSSSSSSSFLSSCSPSSASHYQFLYGSKLVQLLCIVIDHLTLLSLPSSSSVSSSAVATASSLTMRQPSPSSSSSSQLIIDLSVDDEDDINPYTPTEVMGKTILPYSKDDSGCQPQSQPQPNPQLQPFTKEDLLKLRKELVELFVIEANAMKFYGESTYPFLIYETEYLDKQFQQQPSTSNSAFSWSFDFQRYFLGSQQRRFPVFSSEINPLLSFLQSHHSEVSHLLVQEKEKFEKGLSKLVKDGEGLPTLFRKNYLKPYFSFVRRDLNQDGYEVIEDDQHSSLKFVPDESEVEEEDDDDDDEDDY
jgi:hypothetical protein